MQPSDARRAANSAAEGKQLLEELFHNSEAHLSTPAYLDFIRFITKFKSQGPYNAYLLQRQNPRVTFVASALTWQYRYGAKLRPNARPLVILVPFGPIEFVYDIEDVEGGELPEQLLDPYLVEGSISPQVWNNTILSAENHHIGIGLVKESIYWAGGCARRLDEPERWPSLVRVVQQGSLFDSGEGEEQSQEAWYVIELNDCLNQTEQYRVLIHELAHIVCGHLGQRFARTGSTFAPWPDRQDLPEEVVELEAESTAYIVGRRAGLNPHSESYLAPYIESVLGENLIGYFSVDAVLSGANRIEAWGKRKTRPRKNHNSAARNLRKIKNVLNFPSGDADGVSGR